MTGLVAEDDECGTENVDGSGLTFRHPRALLSVILGLDFPSSSGLTFRHPWA